MDLNQNYSTGANYVPNYGIRFINHSYSISRTENKGKL